MKRSRVVACCLSKPDGTQRLSMGDVAEGELLKRSGGKIVGGSASGGGAHPLIGADHTAAGLTPGHVLRATGATTFAFGAIGDADMPAGVARDSEVAAAVVAHEQASDPHPGYTTDAEAEAAASAAVAVHAAAGDPHAGYQLESQKGAANGYASLGANGLVPAGQLPPAGGGSDPWTKVILGADFTTSGTANAAVAGLQFTPAAGKRYLVQFYLLLRTATATVGPRPGISWPGGTTDGGAYMQAPNSATAFGFRSWGPLTTANAASTGVPNTTSSHLATGEAYFITGASPSGTFGITLASETSGTVVTVKAGSFLLYREI
jgi:hypothetical protein